MWSRSYDASGHQDVEPSRGGILDERASFARHVSERNGAHDAPSVIQPVVDPDLSTTKTFKLSSPQFTFLLLKRQFDDYKLIKN